MNGMVAQTVSPGNDILGETGYEGGDCLSGYRELGIGGNKFCFNVLV